MDDLEEEEKKRLVQVAERDLFKQRFNLQIEQTMNKGLPTDGLTPAQTADMERAAVALEQKIARATKGIANLHETYPEFFLDPKPEPEVSPK